VTASWARRCLHLGDKRLGALLFVAQLPELRERYPQLAKAVAEELLDVVSRISHSHDSWLAEENLGHKKREVIAALALMRLFS